MKALQILKEVSLNNKWLEENGFFFGDRKIKEAIKELEELEIRSCSTCSKNSYLDCPCWTYLDGKITDIKYCSEWTKKHKITNI